MRTVKDHRVGNNAAFVPFIFLVVKKDVDLSWKTMVHFFHPCLMGLSKAIFFDWSFCFGDCLVHICNLMNMKKEML